MAKDTGPFWRDTLAYAGVWRLDAQDRSRLCFEGSAPDRPAVYAFVIAGRPVYVGMTGRHVSERLDDFRRGHSAQKTQARVHEEIIAALMAGHEVEIYLHSFSGGRDFADNAWELRNTLRAAYVPDWNRQQAA